VFGIQNQVLVSCGYRDTANFRQDSKCVLPVCPSWFLLLFISNTMIWGKLVIGCPRKPREVCARFRKPPKGEGHLAANLPIHHGVRLWYRPPETDTHALLAISEFKLKHLLLCFMWDVKTSCTCLQRSASYALIGYTCTIYHLTYHNKNSKYICVKSRI
jgi:hypothetical protein